MSAERERRQTKGSLRAEGVRDLDDIRMVTREEDITLCYDVLLLVLADDMLLLDDLDRVFGPCLAVDGANNVPETAVTEEFPKDEILRVFGAWCLAWRSWSRRRRRKRCLRARHFLFFSQR